jgi:SAM-dependent methyltransferase
VSRARRAGELTPGAFFDLEAERYDSGYTARGRRSRALNARLQTVLPELGNGPGLVLDAGMGGGRLLAELEQRGWTVTGIDAAPRMVELARARLPAAGERLLVAELEALPFPDASFDAVTASGVLEFTTDLERALAELWRVLRPGGRAVVSFPNYRSPYSVWRRGLYTLVRALKSVAGARRPSPLLLRHTLPPARFERLLEDAGFVLDDCGPVRAHPRLERLAPSFFFAQLVFAAHKEAGS